MTPSNENFAGIAEHKIVKNVAKDCMNNCTMIKNEVKSYIDPVFVGQATYLNHQQLSPAKQSLKEVKKDVNNSDEDKDKLGLRS